jgi:hypothetical protein
MLVLARIAVYKGYEFPSLSRIDSVRVVVVVCMETRTGCSNGRMAVTGQSGVEVNIHSRIPS